MSHKKVASRRRQPPKLPSRPIGGKPASDLKPYVATGTYSWPKGPHGGPVALVIEAHQGSWRASFNIGMLANMPDEHVDGLFVAMINMATKMLTEAGGVL